MLWIQIFKLLIDISYCAFLFKLLISIIDILHHIMFYIKFFLNFFIKYNDLNNNIGSNIFINKFKNSYIIISGGTSGIGKEICKTYYELGFNLIIISRDYKKLKDLKNELQNESKNKMYNKDNDNNYINNQTIDLKQDIQIITFDFNNDYNDIILKLDNLSTEIKSKILVLCNNVGIYNGSFMKNIDTLEEIKSYIDVNIKSFVILTNWFKTNLIVQNNIKDSLIINISSISGAFPDSTNALYSSTKKFMIEYFKEGFKKTSINSEICKNMSFVTCKPSYISTNMTPLVADNIRIISSKNFVDNLQKELYYEYENLYSLNNVIIKNKKIEYNEDNTKSNLLQFYVNKIVRKFKRFLMCEFYPLNCYKENKFDNNNNCFYKEIIGSPSHQLEYYMYKYLGEKFRRFVYDYDLNNL